MNSFFYYDCTHCKRSLFLSCPRYGGPNTQVETIEDIDDNDETQDPDNEETQLPDDIDMDRRTYMYTLESLQIFIKIY